MNKSIDWNAVTVGETEFLDCNGDKKKLLAKDGNMCWLKMGIGYYITDVEAMKCWTIYDPLVEVTDGCEWRRFGMSDHLWAVFYKGEIIQHHNKQFVVECPRVWMRKEGRDE